MPSQSSSLVTKACEHCGTDFTVRISIIARDERRFGRFCSVPCQHAFRSTHWQVRFWRNVQRTDSCWLWTGFTYLGYGKIHIQGRKVRAHRVMWELTNGPIPDGMYVCHRCDNPACVNPDHLFLGSPKENTTDMVRKGRQGDRPATLSRGGIKRLTEDQVREIRTAVADGASQYSVAKQYGIGHSTVNAVVQRHTWKHVE